MTGVMRAPLPPLNVIGLNIPIAGGCCGSITPAPIPIDFLAPATELRWGITPPHIKASQILLATSESVVQLET